LRNSVGLVANKKKPRERGFVVFKRISV
jgi:hypothetical protein